ncbi:cysteine hydrolase family protein [Campylobacter insulaenigrae]|uniref:nicotinamidase n=1 Tax=Campylobacter insulaenigrae TaxID=260714 RepID=A0ABY3G3U1_9BACT|nr:isochorismatase family cysteine hydrolase [Campylobacter insulaenigrae]MCR6588054.1 cysteine hydrolase [Campylobacter insulaenigrae]TWO25934.1 cysteine hydrolase [Campylobacter insulaenigrae]
MPKLLVVVDYQNDFIDGSLGFKQAIGIKDNIISLLKNHQGDIVFTFDTHEQNYLSTKEGENIPVLHCIKNTSGWLMPQEFDYYLKQSKRIFYKNSFGSLEFANFLKDNFYDCIEFCGLVSHICVFSNIILAQSASCNSEIILHKDASASFDEKLEQSSFDILRAYGVKIV